MAIKINEDGSLTCPSCGDYYLHHSLVEVYERSEDEEKGIHVSIAKKEVKIDTCLDGNPSRRRHGLKIQFWCEGCLEISYLKISQHKGFTLVDFEVMEE